MADSVLALRSWYNQTVPIRTLSIVATITEARDGINIVAFASDNNSPVKSVAIQGNKATLATNNSQVCNFFWAATSMRAGSNDISILMTNTTGAQYITTATIGRP